jgi:hypothetical protein
MIIYHFDNATQLTSSSYTIELLVKEDMGTTGYVVSYGADQRNTQLWLGGRRCILLLDIQVLSAELNVYTETTVCGITGL